MVDGDDQEFDGDEQHYEEERFVEEDLCFASEAIPTVMDETEAMVFLNECMSENYFGGKGRRKGKGKGGNGKKQCRKATLAMGGGLNDQQPGGKLTDDLLIAR